jgi:hypothetical protein
MHGGSLKIIITFSLVKCLAKVLTITAHKLRQSRAARSVLPKLMYVVGMVFDKVSCGFVNPGLGVVLLVTTWFYVYAVRPRQIFCGCSNHAEGERRDMGPVWGRGEYKVLVGNLRESDHFEDLGLDSVILKWSFTTPNVRAWAQGYCGWW